MNDSDDSKMKCSRGRSRNRESLGERERVEGIVIIETRQMGIWYPSSMELVVRGRIRLSKPAG